MSQWKLWGERRFGPLCWTQFFDALNDRNPLRQTSRNALTQRRANPQWRSRILAAGGMIASLVMVASASLTTSMGAAGMSTLKTYLVLVSLQVLVTIYIFELCRGPMLRLLVHVVVRSMYRLRVAGVENIPARGPALLAPNHVTYLDGLVLSAAISRPVRFVAYYEFFRLPVIGRFLRAARVIPIAGAKEDPVVLRQAMREIEKALEQGELVCIFPEGTLTRDGELATFRRGIERIVARTPVPVIPSRLHGLWGSFFSRARRRALGFFPTKPWPRVAVMLGSAISPELVSADGVRTQVAALDEQS